MPQKRHLVAKNEFAFFCICNQVFPGLRAQQVGGNMLMFDVDVKQGLVLKTTRFNDSVNSFF